MAVYAVHSLSLDYAKGRIHMFRSLSTQTHFFLILTMLKSHIFLHINLPLTLYKCILLWPRPSVSYNTQLSHLQVYFDTITSMMLYSPEDSALNGSRYTWAKSLFNILVKRVLDRKREKWSGTEEGQRTKAWETVPSIDVTSSFHVYVTAAMNTCGLKAQF